MSWGAAIKAYQNLAGLTCDSIPGASASSSLIQRSIDRGGSPTHKQCCMPGRRTPGSQIADDLEPTAIIPVIVCGEPGVISRSDLTTTACTHFRPPFLLFPLELPDLRSRSVQILLLTSAGSKYPEEHEPKSLARQLCAKSLNAQR